MSYKSLNEFEFDSDSSSDYSIVDEDCKTPNDINFDVGHRIEDEAKNGEIINHTDSDNSFSYEEAAENSETISASDRSLNEPVDEYILINDVAAVVNESFNENNCEFSFMNENAAGDRSPNEPYAEYKCINEDAIEVSLENSSSPCKNHESETNSLIEELNQKFDIEKPHEDSMVSCLKNPQQLENEELKQKLSDVQLRLHESSQLEEKYQQQINSYETKMGSLERELKMTRNRLDECTLEIHRLDMKNFETEGILAYEINKIKSHEKKGLFSFKRNGSLKEDLNRTEFIKLYTSNKDLTRRYEEAEETIKALRALLNDAVKN